MSSKLLNKKYLKRSKNIRKFIEGKFLRTAKGSIVSIRKGNRKNWKVTDKSTGRYFFTNLNVIPRANYENGSKEMYRQVNGLCVNCGNNSFHCNIDYSHTGYILKNIKCKKCGSVDKWDIIHTYDNNKGVNRGKRYALKKKKLRRKYDKKFQKNFKKNNHINKK